MCGVLSRGLVQDRQRKMRICRLEGEERVGGGEGVGGEGELQDLQTAVKEHQLSFQHQTLILTLKRAGIKRKLNHCTFFKELVSRD